MTGISKAGGVVQELIILDRLLPYGSTKAILLFGVFRMLPIARDQYGQRFEALPTSPSESEPSEVSSPALLLPVFCTTNTPDVL